MIQLFYRLYSTWSYYKTLATFFNCIIHPGCFIHFIHTSLYLFKHLLLHWPSLLSSPHQYQYSGLCICEIVSVLLYSFFLLFFIFHTVFIFLCLVSLNIIFSAAAAKLLQSCPTLCDPIDSSPPGSPVSGILQARILEWVAISFSNAWKWKMKVKSLSPVRLLVTPCIIFSRNNHIFANGRIAFFLMAGNIVYLGFPGGASGKQPAFQCKKHKRHGLDPQLGKIPWSRA